jgi:hypothetical protein
MDKKPEDDIANYKPIRNNILFRFIQDVADGGFNNNTDWGFEIRSKVQDVQTSRWGLIHAVGSEVPERYKPGMYILIEELGWTNNFEIDKVKTWITNDQKILAVSEVEPAGIV